jgi:hypothetical protein
MIKVNQYSGRHGEDFQKILTYCFIFQHKKENTIFTYDNKLKKGEAEG